MPLLDRLSRVTSRGRVYMPVVDGLRFVAIMAVMAYHIRGIVGYHFGYSREINPRNLIDLAFGTGHLGVELFFTISGFILSLPFAEQYLSGGRKVSIKGYYIRRLTRLEPPYLIHLALVVIFCWAILRHHPAHPLLHGDNWLSALLGHVIPSAFYSHAFVFGTHPYPNIVLWSLEAEVQFYLVAPLIATIFSIRNTVVRRGIICVLLFLSSLSGYFVPQDIIKHVMLIGGLPFFLSGFLVTEIYLGTRTHGNSSTTYIWDVVWWISLLGMLLITALYPVLSFITPFLMVTICLGAMRGRVISSVLQWRWITVIGGMCYTIYMYHWFPISGLVRATVHLRTGHAVLDYLLQVCLMTPPILCVSAVLFLLFEKPFMRPNWHLSVWDKVRLSERKG